MPAIHELADGTPPTRRRHVDLLRAVAITAVVVGHWLVMTVEQDPAGNLTGFTALKYMPSMHGITWVFQVMPLFFLVGGFSNAISWTRHRDRGGTAARWLLDRSARLFPPVTLLLVVVAAGAVLASVVGIPQDVVAPAVALVTLPLWFLVVYLGVIALTPAMYKLHERFGLAVPGVLILSVVIGDVLRLTTGVDTWAFGNFVFAWLAIHQIGFAWQDGSLGLTPRRAVIALLGAVILLVVLTGPGPYPVSMVSVPGLAIQNPSPPTVALMALAITQIAVAVLVAASTERWLQRRRPWSAVIAANTVVLTVYLWHMVAALVAAVALDAAGLLPPSDAGSAAWWLGRIPWLVALSIVLAALVALVGRTETRTVAHRLGGARPSSPDGTSEGRVARVARSVPGLTSLPVVAGCYAAAVLGMYLLASAGQGMHGPFGVPTGALVLILSAAATLRFARAAESPRGTGPAQHRPEAQRQPGSRPDGSTQAPTRRDGD